LSQFSATTRDGNRSGLRLLGMNAAEGRCGAEQETKNMQNKFTGSALIVAAALMGAAAYAQDAAVPMQRGPGPMFDFATLDANKDGKITKDELAATKTARFTEADANKDGKLSIEEMSAARDAMIAKRKADRLALMIQRFDKDGDGMISAAEMPSPPNADRMFDRFDTDKDGAISQAEADSAMERMQERMAEHRGKGHGRDGHGKDHGPRGHKGQGGFWGMLDDNAPDGQGN
jgi:Ca2+-binding EF-hand superfamily protein